MLPHPPRRLPIGRRIAVLLLLACNDDPPAGRDREGPVTTTTNTDTTTTSPPQPVVCSPREPLPQPQPPLRGRDPGYADHAGGRPLRLDVEELEVGGSATLTVSGAEPGEEVELWVGDVGALDCPPELDGASFQPVNPALLGVVAADAAGIALLEPVVDEAWDGRWLVFQAKAPGRDALSQAYVDTRLGPDPRGIGSKFPLKLSPLTLRTSGGPWSAASPLHWRIAGGRRSLAEVTGEGGFGVELCLDSAEWGCMDNYPPFYVDLWLADASRWAAVGWFDTLDISTAPTDAPTAWYADTDGDGYGDPSATPVYATVPLEGHAAVATDCDDASPDVAPNAPERCGDGLDQDCDGLDRPCSGGLWPGVGTLLHVPPQCGAYQTVAHDLDGDGCVEAIVPSAGAFALGDSDQTRPILPFDGRGLAVAVGDLTGDGVDDLAILREDDWLEVYAGPVGIHFGEGLPAPVAAGARVDPWADAWDIQCDGDLFVADLTGDGANDLVAAGHDADGVLELEIFAGPIVGPTLTSTPTAWDDPAWTGFVLADEDGDGRDDVWREAVTGDRACVFLAPFGATLEPAACVDGFSPLQALDVDADGHVDLMGISATNVVVLRGPFVGSDTETPAPYFDVPGISGSLFAATPDRDGDGAPDLVVNSAEKVRVLSIIEGVHAFDDGELLSDEGGEGILPVGGDFDGDGWGDVLLEQPIPDWRIAYSYGLVHVLWAR